MGLCVAADSLKQPYVVDLCLFLPCRGALGLQTLNVNQPADMADLAKEAARRGHSLCLWIDNNTVYILQSNHNEEIHMAAIAHTKMSLSLI